MSTTKIQSFCKVLICTASLCALSGCALSPLEPPRGYKFVEIPSVDKTVIHAYWREPLEKNRPVVVYLHGADGVQFKQRPHPYFEGQDWGYLIVDSFRPRGSIKLIPNNPKLLPETRRYDARAAIEWLKKSPYVDPNRIALFGISHGARTVFSTIDANWEGHPQVKCAVAISPGCEAYVGVPAKCNVSTYPNYKTKTPLLILTGAHDTFTPASYCEQLMQKIKADGTEGKIEVLQDAGHNVFQSPQRVKQDLVSPYDNQPTLFGTSKQSATFNKLKMYDFLYRHLRD